MILGSVIGGAFSLTALLPRLPWGLNLPIDISAAAVIIFAAFGKTRVKTFLQRTAVYFASSFSFCGIMMFVHTLFKPDGMGIYNDVVYFDVSPVLLIILTLVCYYILKIIRRFTKGEIGKPTCVAEVEINGESESFTAVIDSGCSLKEPFSGSFVIIAEKRILHDLHPDSDKMRIIPFESLGGSGYLEGYRADSVKINGKPLPCEVYIGLCDGVLKGEIKALVPLEITK
jgi:stage II sporulation protein GA (sporulation sigma-E factor processing peptidase)